MTMPADSSTAAATDFGPLRLADGRFRFRLWAPAVVTVRLEFEHGESMPMNSEADGWFEYITSAAPGTRYRYRIRPDLAVADPASRFQPEDVLGPSELIDSNAYVWTHSHWRGRPWNEIVIYELHVGACGGFEGVRAQLHRLAELGVTAIELMPLADFPGARGWGYDGVLAYAPDAAYGRPEQLKALIDEAHGLGLMVYLDVVYNHFGPEGNFLCDYAPEFFREDQQTPWGPAIDFRRPQVRQYFIQNALYWLQEYRFDGLRLDAVHAITDPGFLDELSHTVRTAMAPGCHVHLMLENERNQAQYLEQAYDAQWNDDLHNVLHVLLTGETEGYYAAYADAPAEQLARSLREGFVYQGQASPIHCGQPRGTPSAHLPPGRFIFFLQNHDQIGNRALGQRLTELAHPDALRAAISLQLLCPCTPLLFMGEEWGCRTPFLFFTDFHDELAEAVRAGRREEFRHFAAFADESSRAHIPDPNQAATFRRSIPDFGAASHKQSADTVAFYRRLLTLRAQALCPRLNGARALRSGALSSHAVAASWQLGDRCELRILTNLGPDRVRIEPRDTQLLFESRDGAGAAIATGLLPEYCTCVYLESPAP